MSSEVFKSLREPSFPQRAELNVRTAIEIDLPPEVHLIAAGVLVSNVVLMCSEQESDLFALTSLYFDAMHRSSGPEDTRTLRWDCRSDVHRPPSQSSKTVLSTVHDDGPGRSLCCDVCAVAASSRSFRRTLAPSPTGASDTCSGGRSTTTGGGAVSRRLPSLPRGESARLGGLTAPPRHPCMRPVMLSAARRS